MTRDPDRLIGEIGLAVLALGFLWRFIVWIGQLPCVCRTRGTKKSKKHCTNLKRVEVCHRCNKPVPPGSWFLRALWLRVVGLLSNNLMPYVHVFSEGEVLRNGINDKLPQNALIVSGYLLVSLSMYLVFAPIYWVFLFRNLKRQKDLVEKTETYHG